MMFCLLLEKKLEGYIYDFLIVLMYLDMEL